MAVNELLHRPVPLDPSLSGDEVPAAQLASTAREHDIVVGTFTDEELVVCGDDPDSSGDRHWTPYLSGLAPAKAEAAKLTCVRLLQSRALLHFDDEGSPVFGQPHATLAWAIARAAALVTWRTDVRDDTSALGGAFVLPHGLVLHDDISPDAGLHEMVLRPQDREGAWLAALLDPTGCATVTDAPQTAATVEELAPRVAELAQGARSSTVMAVTASAGGGQEQAVTTYGADDGVWLFQGRRGQQPGAILHRLEDVDILAVARQLLALADGTPRPTRRWPSRRR
ncbi:MAG: hypothetical protein KY441_08005 [Actinobacteria bacterium]|nr:hypothetical protein [Actinomycetota bacterium]